MKLHTTRTWDMDDYVISVETEAPLDGGDPITTKHGIFGAPALKLADSAVAPLVAAARGYMSFDQTSAEQALKKIGSPRLNSVEGRTVTQMSRSGGGLLIPWYSFKGADVAQRTGDYRIHSAVQFRPTIPEIGPKDKPVKYKFMKDSDLVMDVHPSVPASWIDECETTMIIEGALKADSVLTAMLLGAGLSEDDLAWVGDNNPEAARAHLQELLEGLDEDQRFTVIAIGGVTTWQRNPEWRDINLKDRPVWIGFDGDVAENWNVWNQASKMFEHIQDKGGEPHLIDLSEHSMPNGDKVGIDDYLAGGGDFSGIPPMVTTKLPSRPSKPIEESIGQYRISEDGTRFESCVAVMGESGQPIGARWEVQSRIGGRIVSIVKTRFPTDDEFETGVLNDRVEATDPEVSIEVAFHGDAGIVQKRLIEGPATILMEKPADWAKRKATIPADVLLHEDWPPPAKPEEWLRTIKTHRKDEIDKQTRWGRMGWVPVPEHEGRPVFIIGDMIVGENGVYAPGETSAVSGVDDAELARSSSFGVIPPRPGTEAAQRSEIKGAIENVISVFLKSNAWTSPGVRAAVLSAMFRPVDPNPTRVVIYAVGTKGSGKSYSASHIISGWQAKPGTFTENSLPGSAGDTFAASEHALARAPIWVADDLAPAADSHTANAEIARMGTMIRNVFQNAGKRRMTKDMTSREVARPYALMVVTAENEHPIASVRDRYLELNLGRGSLGSYKDTEPLNEIRDRNGDAGKAVFAAIKTIASLGESPSQWRDDVTVLLSDTSRDFEEDCAKQLQEAGVDAGGAARFSKLASDLSRGLMVLAITAREYGVADELIGAVEEARYDITDVVLAQHRNRYQTQPGAALITAIRNMLAGGKAHLLGASASSTQPFEGEQEGLNHLVGWGVAGGDRGLAPRGTHIGYIIDGSVNKDGIKEPVIVLNRQLAFNEAAKQDRSLIPYGSTMKAVWQSTLEEKLLVSATQIKNATARPDNVSVRIRRKGVVDISGVPVTLSTLLSAGEMTDVDTDE